MKAIEYNAITGEITERELTAEEIAQIQIPSITNDDIRRMREQAYKNRSDSLFMAWQKYLILGDERAEEAKQKWLDEIESINSEYPYVKE